jgi:hypothetical protein
MPAEPAESVGAQREVYIWEFLPAADDSISFGIEHQVTYTGDAADKLLYIVGFADTGPRDPADPHLSLRGQDTMIADCY